MCITEVRRQNRSFLPTRAATESGHARQGEHVSTCFDNTESKFVNAFQAHTQKQWLAAKSMHMAHMGRSEIDVHILKNKHVYFSATIPDSPKYEFLKRQYGMHTLPKESFGEHFFFAAQERPEACTSCSIATT